MARSTRLRYLWLWLDLAKNNLIRQTEFKANFLGRFAIEIVWIFTQFLFFRAAFRFIPDLAGWSEPEIWFFVGSLFFVDGLMMCLFHDNQANFGQLIRLGQFDFYLLYPASSLFLANFRFVNVVSIANVLLSFAVVIWASTFHELHLSALNWLVWFTYCLMGASMVGLLGIIISAATFWTTQSSNFLWLFYELYRLGQRPESLYGPWLRRLLCTVFPAAFFISIPVQLALGKLGGWWFVYPIFILAILIVLSLYVWKRGVAVFEGVMG